jgi:hypothetical protein
MKKAIAFVVCVMTLGLATEAFAQQRPLVTEDPETVGAGNILIEGGFDYQSDLFYPTSGLTGDLLRLPTLGVSFGLSSIAELQIDGGFYNRLAVTDRQPAPLSGALSFTGETTTDVEDLIIATKIRLLSEAPGRPAIAVRLATRLPTASIDSGIGLDTTDFFVSGLIGKTVQSIRIVGNAGLGILTDPTLGSRQNDVMTYGISFARAVKQGVEIVSEVNGRVGLGGDDTPIGTESRSVLRAGARFTHATVRVDGGILVGLTSRDTTFGFTAGVTWVFRGFTVP